MSCSSRGSPIAGPAALTKHTVRTGQTTTEPAEVTGRHTGSCPVAASRLMTSARASGTENYPGPAIPSADRAPGILPLAKVRWRRLARRGVGRPSWLRYCNVTFSPGRISQMGGPHGGAPRDPIAGGLHGGGALHFARVDRMVAAGLTEPRCASERGRRAPRGAPLHGGRQRQIRGSVPSHGARVLEVRIHLPPAVSLQTLGPSR
jgi:hypothetical protein